MNNIYGSLRPLIEKKGIIKDEKQFHQTVNVVFHNFESKYYDEFHQEMWESLPFQYQFLMDDIGKYLKNKSNLKLLDIGCGTGLATEMLLKTVAGPSISDICLVDTSPKMLEIASKRAKKWGRNFKLLNKEIDYVEGKFDIILVSSVLHHIPDLEAFLTEVSRLQSENGIFITIHDPNGDAIDDGIYLSRCEEYSQAIHDNNRKKSNIGKRIFNKIKRTLKVPNYIDLINQKLLKDKIIHTPLDEIEIWSVTDLHVEGLPYSIGRGISKDLLIKRLPCYDLLSYRTYSFYGTLYSNLDSDYRLRENNLARQKDPKGRNFCSAWIKTASN